MPRRSQPMTNPFSQPGAPVIASWSSAASAPSAPLSASQSASFVSDAPQFSRKKARHIPIEQQKTAAATVARSHVAAPWRSQYSAASNTAAISSAKLVGSHRRRQGTGGLFGRTTSDADAAAPLTGSKQDAEKGALLRAILSAGQQSVLAAVQEGQSVFFTGSAGTGKSFLLAYLKHVLPADSQPHLSTPLKIAHFSTRDLPRCRTAMVD